MIAVILYTYAPDGAAGAERGRYAEMTLAALFRHLRTRHDVWLHIADDGSAPSHREKLWALAGQYCGDRRSITNSERRGYGGSYNAASQFVHQLPDVVAIGNLEDDWELQREWDIDPLVDVLLDHNSPIASIRLGYIGYTEELRATFLWLNEAHYLLLDPQSPETHVFAGHPRLETVAYQRHVGPWPENIGAGACELEVAHRLAARTGVAWPADLIPPSGDLFAHIGTVQVANAELGEVSAHAV